tara:strand:- start:1581 stop:2132 length:552 start_codon:yes stop_codon:yes gene_type:complete
MTENTNTNKPKRKRSTMAEMEVKLVAKLEALRARMEGKPDTTSENAILKSLKARLRKTNTELRAARVTLHGQPSKDGSSMLRAPIADKIAATEARLASQIETRDRAQEFEATLPHDVQRLEALIESAEQGDDVEFPNDLTRLSSEQDKTDEQHEASAVITQQDEQAEQDAKDADKRANAGFAQ